MKLRLEKGFSLVELMVALTLTLFLIGGAIVLYASGSGAVNDAERLARAQENLRFATNFLAQELRMTGFFREIAGVPVGFAEIRDTDDNVAVRGPTLRVDYQGSTDCLGETTASIDDEVIANPGVAENTWSLVGNRLICTGKRGASGTMIEGVRLLEFELIQSPNGPVGVIVNLGLEDEPFPDSVYQFRVAFRNPILRSAFE